MNNAGRRNKGNGISSVDALSGGKKYTSPERDLLEGNFIRIVERTVGGSSNKLINAGRSWWLSSTAAEGERESNPQCPKVMFSGCKGGVGYS